MRLFTRDEIPELAFLNSSHKALPDFIAINAKLAVSPDTRELIETLEPGRHQFFDVAIKRARGAKPILGRDGTPLQAPYYLLNPGVRLDAVWIEKSAVTVVNAKDLPPLVLGHPMEDDQMTLYRSVIEGHHLWSGERQLGRCLFFSDALTQAVRDRKMKGLRFLHVREE